MQNSHEWVKYIIDVLFQADDRRIAAAVQRLNTQNSEIRKKNYHGFMHHGIRFIDPRYKSVQAQLAKQPLPTLSLQLMDELRQFDIDRLRIDTDKSRIRQALVPLIVNSQDLQDIRDSIPDCVASLVPQLSVLQRQRQSITTHIQSDKFALKAFEKALPLMEEYSVTALIY